MDQDCLQEFDEAVKNAEESVDSFLHLCTEMEEYLIREDKQGHRDAQKWAKMALEAIGTKLGHSDTREVAIGILIRELHNVGTFILRDCVDEAVFIRFRTEMV